MTMWRVARASTRMSQQNTWQRVSFQPPSGRVARLCCLIMNCTGKKTLGLAQISQQGEQLSLLRFCN